MIETEEAGMLTEFRVENFRGLRELELKDLGRVNIIVGPNASGKTALLEAITIACRAIPQAAIITEQARTVGQAFPGGFPVSTPTGLALALQTNPAALRAMWARFFYRLNMKGKIVFEMQIDERQVRRLEISISPREAVVMPNLPVPPLDVILGDEAPVVKFKRFSGETTESELVAYVGAGNQLVVQQAPPLGPNAIFFLATLPVIEHDNVSWASQLTMEGRKKEIVTQLSRQFPRIKNLEILSLAGTPGIYLEYEGIEELLPVGAVSAGMARILSFLLASLSLKKSIILIDELENGVYYQRYEGLWRMLVELADEQDNQLFITTHSQECLEAATDLIEERVDLFRLIRMEEMKENGKTEIYPHILKEKILFRLLKTGLEARGREFSA